MENNPIRIILLGGPSLALLENNIDTLRDKSCIFYAINRKSHIETQLLSKIDRWVTHWCVLSPPELCHVKDELADFLSSPNTKQLITSSAALEMAFGNASPKSNKLLIADDWVRKAYDFYHATTSKPPLEKLIEADGALNSLFVLLLGLLLQDDKTPILLFGCDGAPDNYKKTGTCSYFGMDAADDAERTQSSNIYHDTVNFERYWKPCIEHYNLDDSCITNVNPKSYYSVFPKQPIESTSLMA